jgi:diguanylate cyclase (GGDEF)-like protein
MALVALLPALLLAYFLATRNAEQRADRATERMTRSAAAMAQAVEQFIDKHRLAVVGAADAIGSAGNFDPIGLRRWLQIWHTNYPDFLTMMVADGQARIVTATRISNGNALAITGGGIQRVTDREYFQVAMREHRAFVSDAFRGRGIGDDAIVAISAPIDAGEAQTWGIVEGSLNLGALAELIDRQTLGPGVDVVLLDQHDRVIYASPALGLELLDELVDAAWVAPAGGTRAGTGYEQVTAPTGANWRLALRLSLREIDAAKWTEFRIASAWLTLALIGALALALLLAKGISRPLAWLDHSVSALDPDRALPPTPRAAPPEIMRIAVHLGEVSERLRRSYSALRESLADGERLREELAGVVRSREAEIAERTRELERANATLEALTRRDALTGLANRRGLDEHLEQTWQFGLREMKPIAIVLIDIDFFKPFNDTYGHPAGDACLTRVASAVAGAGQRPLDLAARYGGEEFALVLPDTPLAGAVHTAERARAAVEALAIPHRHSPFGIVTISLGVAVTMPGHLDGVPAFLAQADRALYAAKHRGRNRAGVAEEASDDMQRTRGGNA